MAAKRSKDPAVCELLEDVDDDFTAKSSFNEHQKRSGNRKQRQSHVRSVAKDVPTQESAQRPTGAAESDQDDEVEDNNRSTTSEHDSEFWDESEDDMDLTSDEAIVICPVEGCAMMFVHVRDYYKHLKRHPVHLRQRLAKRLRDWTPFDSHRPMCSTCGDVLTIASEHNDGCGDGELEWRVADAPFELLGDMSLETMARARAVKTSRKLNRRATVN